MANNKTETLTLTADDATAKAVVSMANGDLTRDAKRENVYSAYVAEHNVTLDTVKVHVKALTELAYPGVKPSNKDDATPRQHKAKNFQNKIRNGLNYAIGGRPARDTDWLKLVRQAVENAHDKGGAEVNDILAVVESALDIA